MKPIKLIARGLVTGQVALTPELITALQQLAAQGDPDKTTVITITEVAITTSAGSSPAPDEAHFHRPISSRPLPPRLRCRTGL